MFRFQDAGYWIKEKVKNWEGERDLNSEVGPDVVLLIAELCRGYRCGSRNVLNSECGMRKREKGARSKISEKENSRISNFEEMTAGPPTEFNYLSSLK